MYIAISVLLAIWVACSSSVPISDVYEGFHVDDAIFHQNVSQEVQHAKIGSKVCMGDLGCFEITKDFFHPLYRPINLLPKDRITIDTKFQLFTKSNPKKEYLLDVSKPNEIKNSPLNPKNPTTFIVHGFIENKIYGKWLIDMKDEYLINGDFNVILVDWSRGNGAPYTQATANTRVVGAEIALMITTLNKLMGVSLMDCHIVGHSLGSHIAGYAGERLEKLGRISGVDPAEPYFQNMPPSVRLDVTDADFVDVIHTDSKSIALMGLGMSQTVGHVDFFPNNGRSQPGCKTQGFRSLITDGLIEGTRRFMACDHQRSVDFFHHSINHQNPPPVGYACASWQDFLNGQCADCGPDGSRCAIMGQRSDEWRRHKKDSESLVLYLTTGGKAPFWVSQFQISVKLSSSSTDRKGKLFVILNGVKKVFKADLTPKAISLKHGETYQYLATSDGDLGEIRSVVFSWETSSVTILRTHTISVEYVKVVPMSIPDEAERQKQTKKFCISTGVDSKKTLELKQTNC